MTYRDTAVPAQTIREAIRQIEEIPPMGDVAGRVRVMVGRAYLDADGVTSSEQFSTFVIEGDSYAALTQATGTYKNEDLWPFIDALRSAPTPTVPPMIGGVKVAL